MPWQSIYRSLQAQALMLSYLDVFKIMAVGCLAVVVLVLFVRRLDPNEQPAPAAH